MPEKVVLVDGKASPVPDVFGTKNEVYSASFTIGAEAGNVINVAIQLKDFRGANLLRQTVVLAYLASDAGGLDITTTGPSTETAIGTDGSLAALVAKKVYMLICEVDGKIDINITEAGAATWYLCLVMADGTTNRARSNAITFV